MKYTWWQTFKSRIVCMFKGCDARCGYNNKCGKCSVYDPNKTNCNIVY